MGGRRESRDGVGEVEVGVRYVCGFERGVGASWDGQE